MQYPSAPWWTRRRQRVLGAWLQARALFSRVLSYRKSAWVLSDYPVRHRKQDLSQPSPWDSQGTRPAWIAQIINWNAVGGSGDTRAAARSDLARNFDRYRETQGELPRPGVRVPVEFAPRGLIDANLEIGNDFVVRVLGAAPGEWFWFSNESSLHDFPDKGSVDDLLRKTQSEYGIDVSDVDGARIGLILGRIAASRSRG